LTTHKGFGKKVNLCFHVKKEKQSILDLLVSFINQMDDLSVLHFTINMDNSSRFVGLPPDLASNQNQIYRDPLLPPVTVQKQLLRLLTLHAFGSSSTSSWDSCPCLTLILLWRMWWSWTFSVCNFSKNRGHVEAKYQIKAREQSGLVNVA